MSQRLIDAEHLRVSIYKKFKESGEPFFPKCRQEDVRLVDSEPTIDPVKHGHWAEYSNGVYYCSECHEEAYWDTDYGQQLFEYCPYCGAKMDEATE